MATSHVYKNSKVYSGGYNISGALNTVTLGYAFDEKEVRCLGSTCTYFVPGLAKLNFELEGYGYSDGIRRTGGRYRGPSRHRFRPDDLRTHDRRRR